MKLKVRTQPEATAQAKEIARWWKQNRPKAPTLFREELRHAIELLRSTPEMGALYPEPSLPGLRRLLLPKTGYHVYYLYDEASSELVVFAIWGSTQGQTPRF